LEALRTQLAGSGVVSLTSAPLDGRLYWMATFNDGGVKRLDISGHVAPTTDDELAQAAQRIAGDHAIAEQGLVNQEDAYYYARQRRRVDEVVLPVYRVILKDDEQTRYYIDPNTGVLLQRADSNGRWRRWLFSGLHRLDFTDWMRARPFRDVLMWLTLLGGLAASVTGVYLAFRRVRSDIFVLLRFLRSFAAGSREEKQIAG
jgi:uncharacterized iron-regulated membrane protein